MELNDDELDERGTEEWTNSIDRVSLWHVSENAYNSFYFIEDEIRHHLLAAKVDKMTVGTQSKLINAVIEGEDASFSGVSLQQWLRMNLHYNFWKWLWNSM